MNRPAPLVAAIVAVAATAGATFVVGKSNHHSQPGNATGTNPTLTTARIERTDLVATQQVTGTLGYPPGPRVVDELAGTYTAMPDEGTIVQPGQALFSIDTTPVVLLAGSIPAWRSFTTGMTNGPDVAQLQAAITAIPGASGIRVDGHYGPATIAAVRHWQRGLGLQPNATIVLGRVIFSPGAVRVGHHRAAVGDRAAPGESPYDTTGATRVVTIDLDVARQAGVHAGLPVTVELPSGSRTPGRVFAVGRVAQLPPEPSSGARPSITVTVVLDDPAAAGDLDQQPVAVNVTTATHKGVLAVPITALLALREGGYGVEVTDVGGQHRVVAVTPGLFTETLVEIQGAGLRADTTVVTAQ